MEVEASVVKLLQRIGISRGQSVLDFGCGYGMYTIPVARVVAGQGRVYALDKDKEALDALMQEAKSVGLKNIVKIETSGELEIEIAEESVDVVLLFDVFHSFYFPQVEDRRRLLGEIYRIMKPSAFLAIAVWPNLIEPETEDEIKNMDFRLEKEVRERLTDDNKYHGTRKILCFRKERYVLALTNQFRWTKKAKNIESEPTYNRALQTAEEMGKANEKLSQVLIELQKSG